MIYNDAIVTGLCLISGALGSLVGYTLGILTKIEKKQEKEGEEDDAQTNT